MGAWSKDSKSHVAHMTGGDFYAQRTVGRRLGGRASCASSWPTPPATTTVLKDGVAVTEGDVIAASVMSRRALTAFFAKAIDDAKAKGVLLSLHLKATMMKVSDPIMFGHAVRVYYKDVFDKHADDLRRARRRSRQRHRRRLREDSEVARGQARRDRGGPAGRLREAAAAGDGRFEQRHHQPARAERRDHRRVDAGGDSRLGSDVGTRRQAARHEGDDPRSLVRGDLSGHHRRLQSSTARSTCRRWARCRTWG